VEVVKPDGSACAPGEVGQLVATSLYNFAMPIIRYRFNDFVVMGEPCTCGRTLPVIAKILGRERGVFYFEDGTSLLPEFRTEAFRQLAGTPYWQVAQTSVDRVEVRLKQPKSLTSDDKDRLRDYIRQNLDRRIEIDIRIVEEFSRSQGGKFYPVVREFPAAIQQ
jgi:phenylacetate-CoA ligase